MIPLRLFFSAGIAPSQPPMTAAGVQASADALMETLGPTNARRVARAILARSKGRSEAVALLADAIVALDEARASPDAHVDTAFDAIEHADALRKIRDEST